MAKRPKVHGWNSEYLEVGFTKDEAVMLRDIMGFLSDHSAYKPRAQGTGNPMTPEVKFNKNVFKDEDEFIHAVADQLFRVIHARTGTN